MRDILFKAKRLDNGEWVYGDLLYDVIIEMTAERSEAVVVTPLHGSFAVDPATVCQYTGLTDKNGVKIFEGDVVDACLDPEVVEGEVKFEERIACFCIVINDQDFTTFLDYRIAKNKVNDRVWIEVVCNIHDKEATHATD